MAMDCPSNGSFEACFARVVCLPAFLAAFLFATPSHSQDAEVRLDGGKSMEWIAPLSRAEWSEAAGTTGSAHTFKATLVPEGADAKAGEKPLSQSRQYRIDTGDDAPPAIVRIVPEDTVLDPAAPVLVFEIRDAAGGSGLLYDSGEAPVEVKVTPSGALRDWAAKPVQKDGKDLFELTIRFQEGMAEFTGGGDYGVRIVARDALGNEAVHEGTYGHSPVAANHFQAENQELGAQLITCTYPLPIALQTELLSGTTGDTPLPENLLRLGGDPGRLRVRLSKLPYFNDQVIAQILDAIQVTTSGPVTAGMPTSQGAQSVIVPIQAVAGGTSLDEGSLNVMFPRQVRVTYQAPRRFTGGAVEIDACPEIDPGYQWDVSTGGIKASEILSPTAAHVTAKANVSDVQMGAESATVNVALTVMRGAKLPTGRMEYDAEKKIARFVVQAEPGLAFSTGRSRATLVLAGADAVDAILLGDNGYTFEFEDVPEGSYQLQADLAAIGYIENPDDGSLHARVLLPASGVLAGPPPMIEDLTYDYAKQELVLKVSDQGTPPEELAGVVYAGAVPFEVNFDANGAARLPLPMPQFRTEVSFSVKDLAQQTTSQTHEVEGIELYALGEKKEAGDGSSFSVGLPDGVSPLEYLVDGRQAYRRICPAVCTYRKVDLPTGTQDGFAFGARSSSRRKRHLDLPGGATGANSFSVPEEAAKKGNKYGELYKQTYLNLYKKPPDSGTRRSSSGSGAVGIKRRPRPQPTTFNYRMEKSCSAAHACGPVLYQDTLPPEIEHFQVVPENGRFSALVSDHGENLSGLAIDFRITTGTQILAKADVASAFDPTSGRLQVQYPIGASGPAERTVVRLTITDVADNKAQAIRTVTIPMAPPTISLRHHLVPDARRSVGLFASVEDPSGLDADLTQLRIDGIPCPAVRVAGIGWDPIGTWYCRAEMLEGAHVFSAVAADTVGLRSEAVHPFALNFAPVISNLHLAGGNPETPGESVFEALVTDVGGDLNLTGFEFSIDGQPVPNGQTIYDVSSGYFSVDGPVALLPGFHRAVLNVTDGGGNTATARLNFNSGVAATLAEAGEGDVRLDSVFLWELQNGNGDGLATPGELVRLFVTLSNQGNAALENLTLKATASDVGVDIERATLGIGVLTTGQTLTLPEGLDLRIADDILTREGAGVDRREVMLDLEISDAGGGVWPLGTGFTVFEERVSLSGATVTVAAAEAQNVLPTISLTQPTEAQLLDFGVGLPPVAVVVQGTFTEGDSPFNVLNLRVENTDTSAVAFDATPTVTGAGAFSQSVNLTAGAHSVTADMQTEDGDQAQATSSFTVALVPPALPSIFITSPADGAVLPGGVVPQSVTISGTYDTAGNPDFSFFGNITCPGVLFFFDPLVITGPGTWEKTITLTNASSENCTGTIKMEVGESNFFEDTVSFTIALEPAGGGEGEGGESGEEEGGGEGEEEGG